MESNLLMNLQSRLEYQAGKAYNCPGALNPLGAQRLKVHHVFNEFVVISAIANVSVNTVNH